MRTEDQVITQFNMRLIRAVMPQGAPMIVVYEDPKDYPGLFVARLFDGRKSTHLIYTRLQQILMHIHQKKLLPLS